MSVTVTLTIVAEDDRQLGRIVSAFGRALQADDDVPGQNAGKAAASAGREATAAPDPAEWYRVHGAEFVEALKPQARRALAAIVLDGPDVPIDLVRKATGRSGTGLAGTLASIGAACKRLSAPRPFEADHKSRIYRIDRGVIEALRPHLA